MATPIPARNDASDVEDLRPENQRPYLANPLTVMLPESELSEIAVRFALSGQALESALTYLNTAIISKSDGLAKQYDAQKKAFEEALARAVEEIKAERESIQAATSTVDTLKQEKVRASERIRGLRCEISRNILDIRKARLQNERNFFKEEDEHLRQETDRSHQELLQDMENQLERAKKSYELKREKWSLNEKEYERRREVLREEQKKVEARLAKASAHIERLAEIGITRTTSGFLVWAGYVSFAGVSGVIANLLAKREQEGADYVSLFIRGVTNLLGPTEGQNLWILAAKMFGLVAATLLTVYGILWLADKRLAKFDPDWLAGSEKKKRKKARWSRQELQSQFSVNIPEISRKSYAQLLAAFPYIFVGAVIVFVLSAAGNPTATKANAGATYTGFVINLLATAVLLLYATYIIEPRWHKYPEPQARNAYFAKMRAHWEFATLVGLLIISLIYTAFARVAPTPEANVGTNTAVWGVLALFMTLSSMGLAYGLIQRGLFKDVDHLENDLRLYRRLIEHYSTQPTVEDEFEYSEPAELGEILADYRRTRHELDELRLTHGIKRTFADSLMNLHDFEVLRYWLDSRRISKFKRLRRFIRLPRLLKLSLRALWKINKSTEPDVIDYEVAPEETINVKTYTQEKLQNEERIKEINAEIEEAEKRTATAKLRLADLSSRRDQTEAQQVSLTKEYEHKKVYLVLQQQREMAKFVEAFTVGAMLAKRLGYERPGPPPTPPPPAGDIPPTPPPPTDLQPGGEIGVGQ
ncbi:MAG: hypothetical protein ACJ74G_23010 [Blastocatellia bacterium]